MDTKLRETTSYQLAPLAEHGAEKASPTMRLQRALTSRSRKTANALLNLLGFELNTLTHQRNERERLNKLSKRGYFEEPAFPIPDAIQNSAWRDVLPLLSEYREQLQKLRRREDNQVDFTLNNGFFSSPDAEILYVLVRNLKPRRIVEIGSGNSTRVSRQAILDGKIDCELISIDPFPRAEIDHLADSVRRVMVESIPPEELAALLSPGDFLFIDSSHEVAMGNDCVYEFLRLIPLLRAGVIIHVHDIFLPWDYPLEWVKREPIVGRWAEQYLLHLLLLSAAPPTVIWPGYFVHRQVDNRFSEFFDPKTLLDATSFWMRKS